MIEEALNIIDQIEEHINTCCAITMDPDEVENLIYNLKEILVKLNK